MARAHNNHLRESQNASELDRCAAIANQEMGAVTKAGEVRGELLVLLEHEVAQHAVEAQRRPHRLHRASHVCQHALNLHTFAASHMCELTYIRVRTSAATFPLRLHECFVAVYTVHC